MRPNYHKIYHDLLSIKYPEKLECPKIREQLQKLNSTEEILKLNESLFKTTHETAKTNQQLKTHDKKNNVETAKISKKTRIIYELYV